MSTHESRAAVSHVAPAIESPQERGNKLLLLLADEHDRQAKINERSLYMSRVFHDCGAPACSLGWAFTVPAIRATGFDPETNHGGKWAFHLEWEEWIHLFGPDHRRTHSDQSRVIRQFVAERRASASARRAA